MRTTRIISVATLCLVVHCFEVSGSPPLGERAGLAWQSVSASESCLGRHVDEFRQQHPSASAVTLFKSSRTRVHSEPSRETFIERSDTAGVIRAFSYLFEDGRCAAVSIEELHSTPIEMDVFRNIASQISARVKGYPRHMVEFGKSHASPALVWISGTRHFLVSCPTFSSNGQSRIKIVIADQGGLPSLIGPLRPLSDDENEFSDVLHSIAPTDARQ